MLVRDSHLAGADAQQERVLAEALSGGGDVLVLVTQIDELAREPRLFLRLAGRRLIDRFALIRLPCHRMEAAASPLGALQEENFGTGRALPDDPDERFRTQARHAGPSYSYPW